MNKCNNYKIPCPHALSIDSDPPCIVLSQTDCDTWREKYKREVTDSLSPKEISELEIRLLSS